MLKRMDLSPEGFDALKRIMKSDKVFSVGIIVDEELNTSLFVRQVDGLSTVISANQPKKITDIT